MLVSWAVPKNLPDTPSVNHLAVHTEDHPLEYLTFEGEIPKGEYGGGKVIVWDTGTYETEKFNDSADEGGEVIVTLHGEQDLRPLRADPDRRQELAGAPHEGPAVATAQGSGADAVDAMARSSASRRPNGRSKANGTATGCWSTPTTASCACDPAAAATSPASIRNCSCWPPIWPTTTWCSTARWSRSTNPECRSFGEMQNRARATRIEFWAFDILQFDGRSLLRAKYRDRRKIARDVRRGQRSDRPRTATGRRRRGAGVLAQTALGGGRRQEVGLHLPAGAAVVVVDQGKASGTPRKSSSAAGAQARAVAAAASARC